MYFSIWCDNDFGNKLIIEITYLLGMNFIREITLKQLFK